MRVLVTGAGGQLGCDVVKALAARGHCPYGTDRTQLDITDKRNVEKIFREIRPEAVAHCAAWTDVEGAELCPEEAHKVNVTGTENIAKECRESRVKLLYISTDYVFDGEGENAWQPDTSLKNPVNVYGRTKYEGELAVERLMEQYFIVRVSWLFGKNGHNFVRTMLKNGKCRDTLTVVDDQIGSPTYTADLAVLIVDMLESERFGIYHAAGEGVCSWYSFACEIFRQMAERGYREYDAEHLNVRRVLTRDYPCRVKRPLNSRLDTGKLTENHFEKLPGWKDALRRYLDELGYR